MTKQNDSEATDEPEITITDHALLRYLERVRGLDIEAIRAEILTDELLEQVRVLGGTGKFVTHGHRCIVQNFTMLTIYPRRR